MEASYRRVDACILHGIESSFHVGRHSGYPPVFLWLLGRASGYLAHAASETDRIGRYHSSCRSSVIQPYEVVRTFGEFECAEINPCASSHPLVDDEEVFSSKMLDSIICSRSAVVYGLVRNIDGISASFGDVCLPFGTGKSVRRAFRRPCGSHGERIVIA